MRSVTSQGLSQTAAYTPDFARWRSGSSRIFFDRECRGPLPPGRIGGSRDSRPPKGSGNRPHQSCPAYGDCRRYSIPCCGYQWALRRAPCFLRFDGADVVKDSGKRDDLQRDTCNSFALHDEFCIFENALGMLNAVRNVLEHKLHRIDSLSRYINAPLEAASVLYSRAPRFSFYPRLSSASQQAALPQPIP
jgi:hypothetical protein